MPDTDFTFKTSPDDNVLPAVGLESGHAALEADIAASTATTANLAIGGSLISDIGSASDADWIRVQLVAGQNYEFTVTEPASGGALSDPTLALLDASGIQLTLNDDWNGLLPEIRFTPTITGTYYLAVTGFGGETGNYQVNAQVEGPADAITWNYTAPSNINVYFVTSANVPIIEPDGTGYNTTAGWTASQINQAMAAFEAFTEVANVNFTRTTSLANADFVMIQSTADGNLGYWGVGGGGLTVNGTTVYVDGYGAFNSTDPSWESSSLNPGGYGFVTLIHEIGHGIGLAHPHDDGGGSTIMHGVTEPFDDLGDFNLNQGIYTTMSYNDGWQTAPHGLPPTNDYGWQGTLMALDIAVLQERYGANTSHNAGNTAYTLPGTNAAGTYFSSIWDGGGVDVISYIGNAAATIDLRAATLNYGSLGGGAISYVHGVHGGFTIAHGVVIENASGGSGSDTITGNGSANTLSGNAGNDTLAGGLGGDTLGGGGGSDTASYAGSNAGVSVSLLTGSVGGGHAAGDTFSSIENLAGSAFNDALAGDNVSNVLSGNGGGDLLRGRGGADTLNGGAGEDTADYIDSNAGVAVSLLTGFSAGGHAAGDTFSLIENLTGSAFKDTLVGNNSANVLTGLVGNDALYGNGGLDTAGYAGSNAGVAVSLLTGFVAGGHAAGDTFVSIENLTGSAFKDTLVGNNSANVVTGLAGNDALFGNGGSDTAAYSGSNAGVAVSLLTGFAAGGHAAGDIFSSIENLTGSAFRDTLVGNHSANVLTGLAGNDTLRGFGGVDRFIFGDGFGQDIIVDWVNGELLDFTGATQIDAIGDLTIGSSGGNAVITDGLGNQITVNGAAGQVDASDFVF